MTSDHDTAVAGAVTPSRLRVAVGGIRYEANSFAGIGCPQSVFDGDVVRRGDEVLALAPPNSELFGARGVLQGAGDIDVVGLLDTYPGCGSPVPHDAYVRLRDEFTSRLQAALPVHGVLLTLHGAMATDADDDVEGDLLRAIRDIVGRDVPLVVSMDLHAAVSASSAALVDGIVGFKTCPHTDYEETGQRSAALLLNAVRAVSSPAVVVHPVPMITPAEAHDTDSGALAPHMNRAQVLADGQQILDVSIFAAQPWLDAARTRWTVAVTYDRAQEGGETAAARIAGHLAEALEADRESFQVIKTPVDAVWTSILGLSDRPVLVADSGDSPSAGADGDSLDCLSHLIGDGHPSVLATLTDPDLAKRASLSPLGGEIDGGPLSPAVTVIATTTGRFARTYPAGPVDVGLCAVVRVANATVVVTERPAFMVDTSLFDQVGLDPSDFDVVQVKSAGGFRALWAPISDASVVVDSLGGSTSRLLELPFQKVVRPLWPFDKLESVQSGEFT